ncbi:hypothetical protein PHLGIDRAFT_119965, partial [Phlebiopsis gigantea 11061_1 CR5-6]
MPSRSTLSEGCALDKNGQLKDAANIEWHHSEDESSGPPLLRASSSKTKPTLRPSTLAERIAGSRRIRRKTWKAEGQPSAAASSSRITITVGKPPEPEPKHSTKRKRVASSDGEHGDDDGEEACEHEDDEYEDGHDNNEGGDDANEGSEGSGRDEDGDGVVEYERMWVEIESERRSMPKVKKTDATRDLSGIFKPDERVVNGKNVKGHWCSVCRDRGAPSWFSGGVSTLRSHISRFWTTHGNIYLKKCRDLEVEPNHRALPAKEGATAEKTAANGTLDDFSLFS